MERERVCLDLRKAEKRNRVAATLAPPVHLGRQDPREALRGPTAECEVKGRRQEQGAAVGVDGRLPATPEHVAARVGPVWNHDRVGGIALGETVPRGEVCRVTRQDVAVLL